MLLFKVKHVLLFDSEGVIIKLLNVTDLSCCKYCMEALFGNVKLCSKFFSPFTLH